MKIYCETGALTKNVKILGRNPNIELVHFPYDPDSHSRKITSIAVPSCAELQDLNLTIAELPGQVSDYWGSVHFGEILSIIGHLNWRDALHIDSAVKTGCSAFVTQDTDILKHTSPLEKLLGIKFFSDSDICGLEEFVAQESNNERLGS
jgi:hypothetical protein